MCYDLRFPVWSRQSSLGLRERPGEELYDVLLYVANWPQRRIHAWKILLQARAIENQCFTIGVNRTGYDGNNIYHTGDSMLVNAMGEILYQKTDVEDVFTIILQKEELAQTRNKFSFWKDADKFTISNDKKIIYTADKIFTGTKM